MLALGNKQAVELSIDGAGLVVRAGAAPVVDGVEEQRMRVGCGSATIGIFAKQWFGHVDEVVVVDDHITGVLTGEHQAGRCLGMTRSGIKIRGRKSTPGRYFQVAKSGHRLGRHRNATRPARDYRLRSAVAQPGMRLLMVSTTGEHAQWYELDHELVPRIAAIPDAVRRTVERIGESCEPSRGAVSRRRGRQLCAGATENPVLLTRAIKQQLVNVTCGGAPAYVWARRRHHRDGRRVAHARPFVRHRAHAGDRRADRIHHDV